MKTAPSGWTNIVNGGNYTYECKLNIAGVDILQSGIYEMTINGSAVSASASIGGAIAGEINVVIDIIAKDDPDINLNGGTFIWTDGDNASGGTFWSGGISADGGTFKGIYIPKMASLIPYIRVVSDGNGATSAWLKMGEYFIDTREKDVKNGKFTAHGYDAMLKAEQTYMPSVTSGAMTTKAIVGEIATLIGVGVADSTNAILNATYDVPYYAGQYTAREMLQYIGAAYYGSFIIDDYGNLKLIQLTSTGTNTDIGGRAKSFELSEETLTYNKIVIVTSPTEEITAGSGNNILEFDCPFGTQAMANAILSALSNYEYRGYSTGTALITPLYEIGDSVTIKGTTLQILKRALRFNALMASDLEAPYSEEIQHEFIYKRQEERKIERLAANTSSEFSIMNTKIEARVTRTELTADLNALKEEIEGEIDGKIETWAQSTNPATAWTTADLRTAHNGDMWFYTGTSNLTVGSTTIKPSMTYQYNGASNTWTLYNSPSKSLFDFADGKSTIFYGNTSGTYTGVETGDYLVDTSTGSTYRYTGSAWEKVTDYDTRFTQDESLIQQNADNIALKVSQTDYNGNEIASLINQTATTVAISADKLTFDGKTVNINAGGFNVTASGSSWSFINLTYGNYVAKFNPQGFVMSYSTWNQESLFYNSGVTLKYNNVTRGFLGFLSSGGNPTLTFYDASSTILAQINGSGKSYTKGTMVIGSADAFTSTTLSVDGNAKATGTWTSTSLKEYKTNIQPIDFDALAVVEKTDIYSFEYKNNVKNGIRDVVYGAIIGDGYNCDEHVMSTDKTGISAHTMASILWQAVKQLHADINELRGAINGKTETDINSDSGNKTGACGSPE